MIFGQPSSMKLAPKMGTQPFRTGVRADGHERLPVCEASMRRLSSQCRHAGGATSGASRVPHQQTGCAPPRNTGSTDLCRSSKTCMCVSGPVSASQESRRVKRRAAGRVIQHTRFVRLPWLTAWQTRARTQAFATTSKPISLPCQAEGQASNFCFISKKTTLSNDYLKGYFPRNSRAKYTWDGVLCKTRLKCIGPWASITHQPSRRDLVN